MVTQEELVAYIITHMLEIQEENIKLLINISLNQAAQEKCMYAILQRAIKETHGNCNNPSKEDYLLAIAWIQDILPPPQNSSKAQNHYQQIYYVINQLEHDT